MSLRLAKIAAALLAVVALLNFAAVLRGDPVPWYSWALLTGMGIGIGGTLLRTPRWSMPLAIGSLVVTLAGAIGLVRSLLHR